MTLAVVPVDLAEANAFVAEHHRHHRAVIGHKFSLGAALADKIVGIVIVGRPVSRHRDDGLTLEVTRLCTDGTRNACSFLYARAKRAAQAMGYRKILTYTLPEESGDSLRAVAWTRAGVAGGGSWSKPSRPREDKHPTQEKIRWECEL
jgi:hypothetical protein